VVVTATIDGLAATLATLHGIEFGAARQAIETRVEQVADDPTLWTGNILTDAGADLIAAQVAHDRPSPVLAHYLDEIRAAAAAMDAIRERLTEATATRDALIRIALRLPNFPHALIAEAARVHESRLYQIRDGSR
jgi:hypothetical protein